MLMALIIKLIQFEMLEWLEDEYDRSIIIAILSREFINANFERDIFFRLKYKHLIWTLYVENE